MPDPITDPALLAQLNGAPVAAPKAIADPALLAQLNEKPSIGEDVAKSGGIGLVKGAVGLAGLPGEAKSLIGSGLSYLESKLGRDPEAIKKSDAAAQAAPSILPTSGEIQSAIESKTGDFYKPKTTAGEYAQTVGEFAPGILGGPGGIVRRGLTQVVAPAIASETAGQLTKGTAAEPYARVAGALVGGIGATSIPSMLKPKPPEDLVSQWMANAVKADGLTPAQAAEKAVQLGPDGMLAEMGPNLRGLTGAVAAQPGAGKADIFSALENRNSGARSRIESAVTDVMGPRINVADLTRENMATRSADAKDLYDKFRTTSIHPTDELKALIPQLDSAGAFSEAAHKAAVEGINWDKNFFTTGERKNYPTAQSWDYVKRALDDKIAGSKNQFGENTDWTRIYTSLKSKLMNAIENSNGEGAEVWKQARQAWGDPTSIMRARQEGLKTWNPAQRRDELLYKLTDYSQPERDAFKQGARDALAEHMDKTVRGDTNTRNMLLAPANKEKLAYLANNKNVNSEDLIKQLERETQFGETRNRTIQNSETEPRRAMGEMMTSKPEDSLIGKIRNYDFARPLRSIPLGQTIEDAAGKYQINKYEKARDMLAPMLVSTGSKRDEILQKLMAGAPAVSAEKISRMDPKRAALINTLLASEASRQPAMQGQ